VIAKRVNVAQLEQCSHPRRCLERWWIHLPVGVGVVVDAIFDSERRILRIWQSHISGSVRSAEIVGGVVRLRIWQSHISGSARGADIVGGVVRLRIWQSDHPDTLFTLHAIADCARYPRPYFAK
jgi:hypothetical protein